MPLDVVDQRVGSASPHLFEVFRFPAERQFGFLKTHAMPNGQGTDGMVPNNSDKLDVSPFEKLSRTGGVLVDYELPQSILLAKDRVRKPPIGKGTAAVSKASWNSMDHTKSLSSLSPEPASYGLSGDTAASNRIEWKSSLFSSSFSEAFSKELKLSQKDVQSLQHAKSVSSRFEEETLESSEEIEAQTIGNLLPTEDDLLAGVADRSGHNGHVANVDDSEDFDLFSSGGGMELESNDHISGRHRNSGLVVGFSNGHIFGRHYPSRTLLVRNVDSNVEDSELKALLEQYGDIQTLYTASKHHGFVMISYYDIRAAQNAIRALQNKPLRLCKLNIHFSIPKDNHTEEDINQGMLIVSNLDSSVSTEELQRVFGVYGDIREIKEVPHKHDLKLIEFYDSRSAEAALPALQGSVIAGKQIKLEPCFLVGPRGLMLQSQREKYEPSPGQSTFDDLSSGTVVTPHAKQFDLLEHSRLVNEMKSGNGRIPNLHPHSLPEGRDGLANGIPLKSSSPISGMMNFGPNMTAGNNNRHVQVVRSNGHLMELNGGIFGSPGNESYSLTGLRDAWNSSNFGQQHHSGGMVWLNSPSFVNSVHTHHHLQNMPGFARARPFVMTSVPGHHHIGSAPTANHSLWERQHTYSAESPEASGFHLGSFGSGGFPGSSPPHPHMFSHPGGSHVDVIKNTGIHSPQQMGNMFPGWNPMVPMAGSFDSPGERVRSCSHRRMESISSNSDKKQYELDIDRVLNGEDSRTTLMIKNIPNKYTSKMLLATIDEHCRGTYDFIYLPIDFKNKCNVGYAFINMMDSRQIIPFHKAFNGNKWEKFNSEKVASIAYGRIQGKAALIAHFQNSSLMNEDKRCRPIIFHTNGPNAGDPEPFPMGTNTRLRFGKPRTSGNEEFHRQGSPSGSDTSSSSD